MPQIVATILNAEGYRLSLLMVATPVGWFGLVIGGALVVGAAAGASIGMNHYAQGKSEGIYDGIMKWISNL